MSTKTKLKYDPLLLGPDDKISIEMEEYIENVTPEFSYMLKRKPVNRSWYGSINGLDDLSNSTLESIGGYNLEFNDDYNSRELNNCDVINEDLKDVFNEKEFSNIYGKNNRFKYFDNMADNQIVFAIQDAKKALDRFDECLMLLDSATVMGGYNQATNSPNNFKKIYATWVYENMFSKRNGINSVTAMFEQLKYMFLTYIPHIKRVINDDTMVLCEVANSSVIFACYDSEEYQKLSTGKTQYNPQYVLIDWARENARICPKCGLWVDNKLDSCSCGHFFELTEEKDREINGDSFVIKMNMEGVTHAAISHALGGDDLGYIDDYLGESIHFFGGGIGCTTTIDLKWSPTGLGCQDYAFIVLQKDGYRIYHEQIQNALMEINDNNEEVVKETLFRFFVALYELKGWDYVIDFVEVLIKDDVVYINAAMEKVIDWMRNVGFVEDYYDSCYGAYVQFKRPADIDMRLSIKETKDDGKSLELVITPNEFEDILDKAISSIGRMAKSLGVKNLIRVNDKSVVSYNFKGNTVIYTDTALECVLKGKHFIFIEVGHNK